MTARFEVYQDKRGGHRWRLRAANGRIVATGEAHTRKRDAERAALRLADLAVQAVSRPMVEAKR